MTDTVEAGRPPEPARTLRWPPPGLERMQGDLGHIAGRFALAGGLLVLPMLFVVAREQRFATLGPFADAWWVTIILGSVGLGFALDALVGTARMLRRSSAAVARGYDLATVAHVVADGSHDMGFLIQGARHFVMLDERERDAMVRIRVFSVALLALGGLWLSIALAIGLLAAARGFVSPRGLWVGTLFPASLAYAIGGVGRLVYDSTIRRARRRFHDQPWAEQLAGHEVEAWRSERAAVGDIGSDGGSKASSPALAPLLRRIALAVLALTGLVALPVMTLMPSSIVGPVLSMIAAPQFDRARQRAAEVEGLRPFVVDVDRSITPQEAGALLHALTYVGSENEPAPGEREPVRRVTQPWLPDVGEANPMGLDPFLWGDSLIAAVTRGTSGAQRSYLAQVAAHPASADFSRLARAGDLDAASGRWTNPFPAGTTVATMPIPRFGPLRAAAQAHVGAAAYALVQGRADRAERLISEVISVGFLLGDHGPTLIDNFIGFALADFGGSALEGLYLVTGDDDALAALRELRQVAERASVRVPIGAPQGTEAWVRSLPELVLDSSTVRGLRWEYFIGITTLTPCLNLHRMVFGPDAEYERFLERAHETLVRFPSEEGLFEMARAGWLGTIQSEGDTWMGRLMSVSMRRGGASCGEILRKIETAQAIF